MTVSDSAAAQILANFAAKSVVLTGSDALIGDSAIPGSPMRDNQAVLPDVMRTPSTSITNTVDGTPGSTLSKRPSSVKKRGPVSKLDGAYFPHKLYRIITAGNAMRWVDDFNFLIVSYELLLNEWRELVNDIKEQTMKDELRKHNFIRNRKIEKERGGQSPGEVWFHREALFRRGEEELLDEIKRKSKKIKPMAEEMGEQRAEPVHLSVAATQTDIVDLSFVGNLPSTAGVPQPPYPM